MSAPDTGIGPETVVRLPKGVRLRADKVRNAMVLLAPERAVALDDIATAIVSALDGVRSLDAIAEELSQQYEAPKAQVLMDVREFVRQFLERGLLEVVS